MLISHLPAFLYLVLAPTEDSLLKADSEDRVPLYERAVELADEAKRPVHIQDSRGFTFEVIHPE